MPLLSIKAWSCLDLHIFCCLSNTLPPTQRPTMASRPFLLMNWILTKGITCQLSSRPTTAILLLYVIGFDALIWGIWTMLRLLKTMGTSEVKLSANRIVKAKVKSKISWLECEMFPNLGQYLVPIWWWLLEGCGTCRKWILIRRSGPLGAGLKVLHPEDELYRQNVWLSMYERSEDMVQGESRADNYHEKRKELEFLLQNIIEHQLQIQEASTQSTHTGCTLHSVPHLSMIGKLSLFTYLGLADKLLKISEQRSYWATCRCTTPLATSRAQKCKNEGPGSGGGAQIWHQIASSVLPGHFHSSLLSGSGDGHKLSLDLHRYPTRDKG